MSLADAVRELNLVKEDRDQLQTKLASRETELQNLRTQLNYMKFKKNIQKDQMAGNVVDNKCQGKGCQCHCHEMVQFALEQFQKNLDEMMNRIEKRFLMVTVENSSGASKHNFCDDNNIRSDVKNLVDNPSGSDAEVERETSSNSNISGSSFNLNGGDSLRAKLNKAKTVGLRRSSRALKNAAFRSSVRKENKDLDSVPGSSSSNIYQNKMLSEECSDKELVTVMKSSEVSKGKVEDLALISNASLSSGVDVKHKFPSKELNAEKIEDYNSPSFQSSTSSNKAALWEEVMISIEAPAFDLDSPVFVNHLKNWTSNSEERLFLCQWLQNFISNHGLNLSKENDDLHLSGLASEAKESFIVIVLPILKDKRPDLPLYAYCRRQTDLSMGTADLGADDDIWDLKLTTNKIYFNETKDGVESGSVCSSNLDTSVMDSSEERYQRKNDSLNDAKDTAELEDTYHNVLTSESQSEDITFRNKDRDALSDASSTKSSQTQKTTPMRTPPRSQNRPPPSPSSNGRRRSIHLSRKKESPTSRNRQKPLPSKENKKNEFFEASDFLNNAFIDDSSNTEENLTKPMRTYSKLKDEKKYQRLNKNIALASRIQSTLENMQKDQGEI